MDDTQPNDMNIYNNKPRVPEKKSKPEGRHRKSLKKTRNVVPNLTREYLVTATCMVRHQ